MAVLTLITVADIDRLPRGADVIPVTVTGHQVLVVVHLPEPGTYLG